MSGDGEVGPGAVTTPRWRDLGDSRDLAAAVRSTYSAMPSTGNAMPPTGAVPESAARPAPDAGRLDAPPDAAVAGDAPPDVETAYIPPPLTTDPLAALRVSVAGRRTRVSLPGRGMLATLAATALLLVSVGSGLPRAVLGRAQPVDVVEPVMEEPARDRAGDGDDREGDDEVSAWTYAPAETPTTTTPAVDAAPAVEPAPPEASSDRPRRAAAGPRPATAAPTNQRRGATATSTTAPSSAAPRDSAPAQNPSPEDPPPEDAPSEDEDVPEGGGW